MLYEDDALIAIDKPPGLAVHGGSGIAFGLIEQLRAARPDARFLELVHRLDRDTSGVLLVAKKRSALVALHAALRDGEVDKRYLVLVRGQVARRQAQRRAPARAVPHRRRRASCSRRAREARVKLRAPSSTRRQVWPRAQPPVSLLEAELMTGRTHQIRVHLTHLGFPLAGDDKYGDFAWNKALVPRRAQAHVPARRTARAGAPAGARVRWPSSRPCRRIWRISSRRLDAPA